MRTHQFFVMILGFLNLRIRPSVTNLRVIKPSAIPHTLAFPYIGHISCSKNRTIRTVHNSRIEYICDQCMVAGRGY